jgi:hypothetical protein
LALNSDDSMRHCACVGSMPSYNRPPSVYARAHTTTDSRACSTCRVVRAGVQKKHRAVWRRHDARAHRFKLKRQALQVDVPATRTHTPEPHKSTPHQAAHSPHAARRHVLVLAHSAGTEAGVLCGHYQSSSAREPVTRNAPKRPQRQPAGHDIPAQC